MGGWRGHRKSGAQTPQKKGSLIFKHQNSSGIKETEKQATILIMTL